MLDKHLIDISRMISPQAVVYPGDSPLGISSLCKIEPGCPCNISELSWTSHFLTHVDVPIHFISEGASLDEVPLHRFSGPALVVQVDGDEVQPEHLPADESLEGKNILFKTRNSMITTDQHFDESHVYVGTRVAELAIQRGVNLIGIDYLSVDRFGDEAYPIHRTLLEANLLILEGLDLTQARPGWYELTALPLRIQNGDGSPVRAVLSTIRS